MSDKQTFHELLVFRDGDFYSEQILEDPKQYDKEADILGAIRTRVLGGDREETSIQLIGFPPESYLRSEEAVNEAIYVQGDTSEEVIFPESRLEELQLLARTHSGAIKIEHYHVATVGSESLYSFPRFTEEGDGKHYMVKDHSTGKTLCNVSGSGLDQPNVSAVNGHWHVEEKGGIDAVYLLSELTDGSVAGVENSFNPGMHALPGGELLKGESITETLLTKCEEAGWSLPRGGLREVGTVKIGNMDVMYADLRCGKMSLIDAVKRPQGPLKPIGRSREELPIVCQELLNEGPLPKVSVSVGDEPMLVQKRNMETGDIDTIVCRDAELINDISENRGLDRDGQRYTFVGYDDSLVSMHHGRSIHQLPYTVAGEDEAAHYIVLNNARQVVDFYKGTGDEAPRFNRVSSEEYSFTSKAKERELADMRGVEFDESNLTNLVQVPDRPDLRLGSHFFIMENELKEDGRPLKYVKDTASVVEAIEVMRDGLNNEQVFEVKRHHIAENQISAIRDDYIARYDAFLQSIENPEVTELDPAPVRMEVSQPRMA